MVPSRFLPPTTRRRFLSSIARLLGGGVAGFAIFPLFGSDPLSAAAPTPGEKWLSLGPLAALIPGIPAAFAVPLPARQDPSGAAQTGVAYAITADGQSVRVFSNVCPHAGCRLHWDGFGNVFRCPCHGAAFDAAGTVLGGRARRSLAEFEARLHEGEIQIRLAA